MRPVSYGNGVFGSVFRTRFRTALPLTRLMVDPVIWINVLLMLQLIYVVNGLPQSAGVEIQLPAVSGQSPIPLNTAVLSVSPKGIVSYMGRSYPLEQSARLLDDVGETVIVEADRATDHGILIKLLETCQDAGIKRVFFATRLQDDHRP